MSLTISSTFKVSFNNNNNKDDDDNDNQENDIYDENSNNNNQPAPLTFHFRKNVMIIYRSHLLIYHQLFSSSEMCRVHFEFRILILILSIFVCVLRLRRAWDGSCVGKTCWGTGSQFNRSFSSKLCTCCTICLLNICIRTLRHTLMCII